MDLSPGVNERLNQLEIDGSRRISIEKILVAAMAVEAHVEPAGAGYINVMNSENKFRIMQITSKGNISVTHYDEKEKENPTKSRNFLCVFSEAVPIYFKHFGLNFEIKQPGSNVIDFPKTAESLARFICALRLLIQLSAIEIQPEVKK